MKISFIIPTYNRANLIQATIKSIIKQRYQNIEILVIDDASTDNTRQSIQEFNQDERFRYYRLPCNKGQNYARNQGIELSTGDIFTIMDSDDQDYGTDLINIVDFFRNHSDVDGVFTLVVSMSSNQVMCNDKSLDKKFGYEGFINGTCEGEYQAFIRKSSLPENTKIFEENLEIKRSCTLLTWLKLGKTLKFQILNFKTKLYNDVHENRMGNALQIVKDAGEIKKCYQLVITQYKEDIQRVSAQYYHELLLRIVYYTLLETGRNDAFQKFKQINPLSTNIKTYFMVFISILLGANCVTAIRSKCQ